MVYHYRLIAGRFILTYGIMIGLTLSRAGLQTTVTSTPTNVYYHVGSYNIRTRNPKPKRPHCSHGLEYS
jgi:hypothetical protein